jgi:thioredoxin-like negative regulator of GroEL
MNKIMDFYAPWCAPCKTLEPHLKAAEIRGVKIEHVDIDKDPETARLFGVSSLPTLLFLKGKEIVDTTIGASPAVIKKIQAFSGD